MKIQLSEWMVVRTEDYDKGTITWHAVNKLTGEEGPERGTYDDAAKDIGD